MFKELDVIALTTEISPDSIWEIPPSSPLSKNRRKGLEVGDIGTIVYIQGDGEALEVEFLDPDGNTVAIATISPSQARPAKEDLTKRSRRSRPMKGKVTQKRTIMPEQHCFVFRIASDADFVQNELQQGRLRQGWSPPGTSLLNAEGSERSKEEWTQAYERAWDGPPSPRRHATLRRILDMNKGDLIFVPKAPQYGYFTIAEVSGCYRFEVDSGQNDFGHIIPVTNLRVVDNWYNGASQTIYELFKSAHFRSPVTQVQDYNTERVLAAAERLRNEDNTDTHQDPATIKQRRYAEVRRKAAESLIQSVNDEWGHDQFEAAVGEAFERKGYELLKSKNTRNGGDADHVFSLPMPGFDEALLESTPLLIVQVKHKTGTDYGDVEGVRQLVKWEPDKGEEVLYKVLFSSAESFTEECKRIAKAKDVILICGTEAGMFML